MPAIDFDATEIIQRMRYAPHGVSHAFVSIGDDWGIRIYTHTFWNKAERRNVVENEFQLHQSAAELGLAPEVGEVVELTSGGITYYGYTVREVETWGTTDDEDNYESIYFDQREELQAAIFEAVGVFPSDIKRENTGIVDGHLVFLDWGEESISAEPEDIYGDDDDVS
jgi:hypothetical protein